MRKTGVLPSRLLWNCVGLLLAAGVPVFAMAGPLASTQTPGDEQAGGGPRAAPQSSASQCQVRFHPPALDEAPEELRPAVLYGHQIVMETRKVVPQYVGNQLDCKNCHFKGGMTKEGITLVGVAAAYPKYRKREGYSVDLVERTNNCFERSENGKPLPPDGKEMQAIMAYYHWISKGIPIYAKVPWLGLKPVEAKQPPNAVKGKEVFAQRCSPCHGANGQGTHMAPPLWGSGSFNDGAGMAHPDKAAAFIHACMPKNHPDLTDQQAVDAAAFVTSQPRPYFKGDSAGNDSPGASDPSEADPPPGGSAQKPAAVKLPQVAISSLASDPIWPPWIAPPSAGKNFTVAMIDNAPDLHGDIVNPQLVVFLAGNQFMLTDELLDAFRREHPEIERIYAETLPPGIEEDQIEQGALIIGNLRIAIGTPDVYTAGRGHIERIQNEKGWFAHTRDYAQNRLAVMVARNNPLNISSLQDLAKPQARVKAIEELKNAGADVYVCGQALHDNGYEEAHVLPDVRVAVSALIVLVSSQDDGYALLPY